MTDRSGVAVRIASASLCLAGALLLGYATVQYARGAYRADVARRQWDAQQAQASVALARERATSGVSAAIERVAAGAPMARLSIPRLHLDEIVLEGVGDDELNAAPGHLPGSALPGMKGNAVISAHRDRHFRHFDELQVGDTVSTETGRGTTTWVIVHRRIVGKDAPALFETSEPMLTLTTCWPVRYFGSAPDRLIISARPVAATSQASVPRPSRTT